MADRYRPPIPWRVKMEVVLRQDGMCGCGCLERLAHLDNTDFDHCPPLALREYDEDTRIYTPDANDPTKIVARVKVHHKKKTNGPRGPHTSLGSDKNMIAKTRNGRDTKFVVQKDAPQPPAPTPEQSYSISRCRGCGGFEGECTCQPRVKPKAFLRRTA